MFSAQLKSQFVGGNCSKTFQFPLLIGYFTKKSCRLAGNIRSLKRQVRNGDVCRRRLPLLVVNRRVLLDENKITVNYVGLRRSGVTEMFSSRGRNIVDGRRLPHESNPDEDVGDKEAQR